MIENYTSANIICDSIDKHGQRLTTMEVTMPRIVLPQFSRHRRFSINSSSSRAKPFETMVKEIEAEFYEPYSVRKNQKGMQGEELLNDCESEEFLRWHKQVWNYLKRETTKIKEQFNPHKQTLNRYIESFGYVKVLVSATEWQNFFNQRIHPHAQPEIELVAKVMFDALNNSIPVLRKAKEFHLPYITQEEFSNHGLELCKRVSVSRNARTSYLSLDRKVITFENDVTLCDKLINAIPPHLSPFEHVAMCTDLKAARYFGPSPFIEDIRIYHQKNCFYNFDGWKSLRFILREET